MTEPVKFGFRVRREEDGGFSVSLPHQCDGWVIAGESCCSGVSVTEALSALTDFIDEAESARAALVAGQEFGL